MDKIELLYIAKNLCIFKPMVYYFLTFLGEEMSLHSKMLLKLRGTFKVRLFQGSDWPESNKLGSGETKSVGNTHGK